MNQLTVDLSGKTPEMAFLDISPATLWLCDCHTWGCLCFILDSRLQTNPKGAPNWEPRARLGIYVGRSPHHAGNVALVLNPNTSLISSQVHVVFNDNFTTLPHLCQGTVPPNWAELVQHSSKKATSEFYDLTKTWFKSQSDETAGRFLDDPSTSDSVGISSQENKGAQESANKGANTEANKGDYPVLQPPSSQAHEGEEALTMPTMIELERSGL